MDPWFYAVHHLPAGTSAQYAAGDGAFTSVDAATTLVYDDTLGRVVLQGREGQVAERTFPASTRFVVGFRHQARSDELLLSPGAGYQSMLRIVNASGVLLSIDRDRTTGNVAVRRGTTNLALYHTVATGEAWHYYELAVVLSNSEGTIIGRLDGVEIFREVGELNTANVTLGSGATGIVLWARLGSNSTCRITDLYLKPFPEGTEEDDTLFYGPIVPQWRAVTAMVSNDGWEDDSAGTTDLHESVKALDGSYIDTTQVGSSVEFELDEVSTANSIIAQVAITVGWSPEGGAPQVAHDFKRGGDETSVDGRVVGSDTPRTQARVHLTQPNGNPWSSAAANASTLVITAA